MKITINDRRKIFAIQEAFSEMFPYLKIEFYSKPSKSGGASSRKFMKTSGKTIGECRTVHSNGTMTILPHMTLADLEGGFSDTFGLSVQVFRRSGSTWLEVTPVNGWTLEEENRAAEEMNKPKSETI